MKRLLILLAGLILLSILGYFCVYKFSGPSVEADIKNRAKAALFRNDFSEIKVDVDGRDIVLKGQVPFEELRDKANRVAAVPGYNTLDSQIEVVEAPEPVPVEVIEPYRLAIGVKEGETIILSGSVPNSETKDQLLKMAQQQYGSSKVSDDLSIKSNAPKNWADMMFSVFSSLPLLSEAEINVSDQELNLKAMTDSEQKRDEITTMLEQTLPENYVGNINIAVAAKDEVVEENPQAKIAEMAKTCQLQFKSLLLRSKVQFRTGMSELNKSSNGLLDQLAKIATSCPDSALIIAGHTDSQGKTRANKKLSQKRAEAVAGYLIKSGVDKKRIQTRGYGSARPIASNRTKKGRAQNRRIEITVKGVQ